MMNVYEVLWIFFFNFMIFKLYPNKEEIWNETTYTNSFIFLYILWHIFYFCFNLKKLKNRINLFQIILNYVDLW